MFCSRTSVSTATVTMVKVVAMEDKPLLTVAMARLPLVSLARQRRLLLLKHNSTTTICTVLQQFTSYAAVGELLTAATGGSWSDRNGWSNGNR
ncbi:hypothetical protein GCK32_000670 [Trichostrongylus colubriformis]|uniref:Uncharacterized protein n=1 Tax=Trichostrongylus colubriformis TaxID=6319 RepID=A0AAN8G8T0_TRICO